MKEFLKDKIDRLLQEKERVVIAIDGPCAAGKSTLGAWLAKEFDCNVFHMDDFFLQPHQRTPERLAQPGGNVDYERFRQELLEPLLTGKPFSFRPYDCASRSLSAPVEVVPKKLNIVEGTYSHHPYFGECYDLRVFLPVSAETQERRVRERPAFLHNRFFDEWIPLENAYFAAFSIREQCDLLLPESH